MGAPRVTRHTSIRCSVDKKLRTNFYKEQEEMLYGNMNEIIKLFLTVFYSVTLQQMLFVA
jgi:hypothetical protein